jgi:hypothetical protein
MGRNGEAARHSVLYYRSLAVQKMAGGGIKEAARVSESPTAATDSGFHLDAMNLEANLELMGKDVTKVMMQSPEISVLESAGEVRVQVMRLHGDLDSTINVAYSCKDDTAMAGLDYVAQEVRAWGEGWIGGGSGGEGLGLRKWGVKLCIKALI